MRLKKDIVDDVAEELDVQISRVNPLKKEWCSILDEIKRIKRENPDGEVFDTDE